MRVRNVHARELAAAPEQVGALLDGLGGEHDRLWPVDRWPATPLALDGPLAVGASGGHGPIRYAVAEHEPGRRLVFRFPPGFGLVGTHRFEVEPLGVQRARLSHTLECDVGPKLLALWPIVRRGHDALIEDLLDRAELATTGRVARPARWPVSVRIANAVEVRVARRQGKVPPARRASGGAIGRLARVCGVGIPATLLALAALHAAWALGWRWPGGSDRELAERVVGHGAALPSAGPTWAVAALLVTAAATVRAGATGASGHVRAAAWGVSVVLTARGLVPIPIDLVGGVEHIYDRLDLAIYSPLSLALGLGTAWLLTRESRSVHGDRAGVLAGGATS